MYYQLYLGHIINRLNLFFLFFHCTSDRFKFELSYFKRIGYKIKLIILNTVVNKGTYKPLYVLVLFNINFL